MQYLLASCFGATLFMGGFLYGHYRAITKIRSLTVILPPNPTNPP